MKDIKEIYTKEEFSTYSQLEGLYPDEEFIINEYCKKEMKVLEAGTGGGRILIEMNQRGFEDLHGFDFIPAYIAVARERDLSKQIDFEVDDALKLHYEDNSFDLLLYLGPLLSNMETHEAQLAVVKEANRILRTNGTAVFSFLLFDVRSQAIIYRAFIAYISCLRKIRRSPLSTQFLPFLRLNDKPNYGALIDRPPYPYWFKMEEAVELLTNNGFSIDACGTNHQLNNGNICSSLEELKREPHRGNIFIICGKSAQAKEPQVIEH